MEEQIKKVNKNYYKIYVEPTTSVFLDEELMKKAAKILYRYKQEIDELLKNNSRHLIKEDWALAYPNGEQKSFYGTDLQPVENAREPLFDVRKVENLYFIGDRSIYEDEVKNEIGKLMENSQ